MIAILDARRREAATLIYAFPHAGGGRLSFGSWDGRMPDGISVVRTEVDIAAGATAGGAPAALSGSMPRIGDEVRRHMAAQRGGTRCVFYGHSYGALVAFEICRHLRRVRAELPAGLAVSGRRAPQCRLTAVPLCLQSDADLLASLSLLSPEAGHRARDAAHLRGMLGRIRGDLFLTDLYEYGDEPPFDLPILAMRGASDPVVSPSEMAGWEAQTTGSFRYAEAPGAHFFDARGTSALIGELVRFATPPRAAAPPRALRPDRAGMREGGWHGNDR